jgi:hypothetical protein
LPGRNIKEQGRTFVDDRLRLIEQITIKCVELLFGVYPTNRCLRKHGFLEVDSTFIFRREKNENIICLDP